MRLYTDLAQDVLEYDRVTTANPSEAVGSRRDALVAKARAALSGSYAAQTSPIAPLRWMNRVVLPQNVLQSEEDPLDFPFPVEIVGFIPTVLLVDTNAQRVQPPLEAIDVYIQLNNDAVLTNRANRVATQTQNFQVCNLPAISATVGNSLMGLVLSEPRNLVTVKFAWAVDLATVAALAYGDVQVSLNYVMRKREDLVK